MDARLEKTTEWTHAQLREVVADSRSWRDVLRALGYSPTSGAAKERVRRMVVESGWSTAHFTRQKPGWNDADLQRAVDAASSWSELLEELGVTSDSAKTRAIIRSRAVRLGVDISQLQPQPWKSNRSLLDMRPQPERLRDAAESLAAAWFQLRGCAVFLPVGQERYDLLVESAAGIQKVQVKSSTHRDEYGSFQALVASVRTHGANRNAAIPYDPGDVDLFFVVDGDGWMYVIPLAVIGGRSKISLNAYAAYRCGSAKGMLGANDSAVDKVCTCTECACDT